MDRRQLLVTAGAVGSISLAGCAGLGGSNNTPDQPYINDSTLETSGELLIVGIVVVNPTEEPIELEAWARLLDEDGSELERGSVSETVGSQETVNLPVTFNPSQYNVSAVESHEVALTRPGTEPTFSES
jgi:hypothetical protein